MSYGKLFKIEIFGESHGPEIGVTIEGLPAGFEPDMEELRAFLKRRAPGRNAWSSARKEPDVPEFTEGLEDGVFTGGRVTAVIKNTDVRKADYDRVGSVPRPGHADLGEYFKYGRISSGGGRFSGRMTAPLCVAGGLCKQLLSREGVEIISRVASVGEVEDEAPLTASTAEKDFPAVSGEAAERMKLRISYARSAGDSVGGVAECKVLGVPAGLGGALFEGIESRIAEIVFAIPAVKGVEFGSGFNAARMSGSQNNDPIVLRDEKIVTATNNAGGILGGITDGMPLVFRTAFKPTPSISLQQRSVYLESMATTTLELTGRHDPCIVPRAVPVLEAAAAIALYDALLQRREELALENEVFAQSKDDLAQSEPASEGPAAGNTEKASYPAEAAAYPAEKAPVAKKTTENRAEKPLDLGECRARLDEIDPMITELFAERLRISADVARFKAANGLPTYDPAREAEKLDKVASQLPEELAPFGRELFKAVMDIGKEYQKKVRSEEKNG